VKVAYWPGCVSRGFTPELHGSMARVAPLLDIELVELDRNVGLGMALDAGLSFCRYDVVARMDADDISVPHRFEVQVPIIEGGADIVGSGLLEFG